MKRVARYMTRSTGVPVDVSPTKKSLQDLDISYLDNLIYNNKVKLPSVESLTSTFNLDSCIICSRYLGGSYFLCAELIKGEVKIFIRKYICDKDLKLIPTKTGICMNLSTWYRFSQKLWYFDLIYTSSSFVSNNKLLVLNQDGDMVLQRMDTLQLITLNGLQLEALKYEVLYKYYKENFNEYLLSFVCESYIPSLIASKFPSTTTCKESDSILKARLVTCLESELSQVFKKEFKCHECIFQSGTPDRHSCRNTRELQKFQELGQLCLLPVDFKSVADNFKQRTSAVSNKFVKNMNVYMLLDVLFKPPNDL